MYYFSRRVCEVTLLGNHQFTIKQQKYKVSEALKTGEASVLFGESYIVACACARPDG